MSSRGSSSPLLFLAAVRERPLGLWAGIDRLVAERGARRGQDDLLDLLDELPKQIPGPPSGDLLDELRSERGR